MLDKIDKILLNRIQSDFPITPRPFQKLGLELGLSERDVIKRVAKLKKTGFIRRIGGNFVPEKLGFVSTLCAAKVSQDKISCFAATVNKYPGVTHNYIRDNEFNIWFTFIAPSMSIVEQHIEEIKRETGVALILNLPATRVFKIKAHFNL